VVNFTYLYAVIWGTAIAVLFNYMHRSFAIFVSLQSSRTRSQMLLASQVNVEFSATNGQHAT